jgi:DsbC/DsbD-like thiol-disulfide interchange protein
MLQRLARNMKLAAALLVLLSCAIAHAATPARMVLPQLIADVDAIKPGVPFRVGVLLTVNSGWHVYWKYPGDSGAPTQVELKLPDGFAAGQVQFPIPRSFNQPGDIVGYGYEDEVMLIIRVTPPAQLQGQQPVELGANVKWLVCKDVCLPGKADLKLTLPIGDSSEAAHTALFERWAALLPAKEGFKSSRVTREDGHFTAGVTLHRPFTQLQWFANPPARTGLANAQTKTSGAESTYSFELLPPPAQAQAMSFLVAYTDADGKRRGVEFTANLPPPHSNP